LQGACVHVTLSQGACYPQTSRDRQPENCMASKTSTFLLNRELSDWAEGGNLPSWSKIQRAFPLSFYR